MHRPLLWIVVGGREVLRYAIVPNGDGVLPPAKADLKIRAFNEIEQGVQESRALQPVQAHYALRIGPIDKQAGPLLFRYPA